MGLHHRATWPHCSFWILTCPQIVVCWLPDCSNKNQPSSSPLESTVPRVIRKANSVEALKCKPTFYLLSLPGRGILQFLLPQLRQHYCRNQLLEAAVEVASWILHLHTPCLPSLWVRMWLKVFALSVFLFVLVWRSDYPSQAWHRCTSSVQMLQLLFSANCLLCSPNFLFCQSFCQRSPFHFLTFMLMSLIKQLHRS